MNEAVRTVTLVLLIVGGLASVGVGGVAAAAPDDSSSQRQTGETTPTANQSDVPQETNVTQGPFRLTVERVENCGLTCRNVTVQLTNRANRSLENVSVESDILAGDELLVERRAQVGSLAPNESVNRTVQVSVGFSAISQIRQADGNITVRTQVTSANYNETFVEKRQLPSLSS